jgi:hypothetical protein
MTCIHLLESNPKRKMKSKLHPSFFNFFLATIQAQSRPHTIHCLRKKKGYCPTCDTYNHNISDVRSWHQHCPSLRSKLVASGNADVSFAHRHCRDRPLVKLTSTLHVASAFIGRWHRGRIITVETGQLSPIATVKWGHVATVPLHSSGHRQPGSRDDGFF